MWEELGKALLTAAYAGVGAVALATEQAGKLGKVLVERGEEAVEQMGKYSEEIQQKVQDDIQRRREAALDERISSLEAWQRDDLRRRLDELDELDRQAAEMAEHSDNITEIHGGFQDSSDNEE